MRAAAPDAPGRHSAGRPLAAWGRWGVTAHHITIAALVVVAAIALASWWVLRSVPDESVQLSSERILPDPTLSTSPTAATSAVSTPAGEVPAPQPPAEQSLVVDVTGKVRRPGIVELPLGSRVIDALTAAGGTKVGVDTATLNLARSLVDGEQIIVGLDVSMGAGPTSPAASTGSAIAPVDLNTATTEQLDTLPGIGPVTAEAILAWRTENGSFTAVSELLEVSGIGDATLAEIEPYVYV